MHLRTRLSWFIQRPKSAHVHQMSSVMLEAPHGTLGIISQHLYAFTFILSDDTIAITQWLRHYVGSIGVLPQHIGVAIRSREGEPEGALNATLAALHTHGVARGHVQVIQGEPSSDLLRLQVINRNVGSVLERDPDACK